MRYQRKPLDVTAEQFTKGNMPVGVRDLGTRFKFRHPDNGHYQAINHGDWVVYFDDGNTQLMTNAEFRDTHSPLPLTAEH